MMIDTTILKQLNNVDPEYRKKAVMELAKTKNRDALNYLASVYRNDKDAEVRELARKAGLFINKHTVSESKRKNDGMFTLDDEDDDYISSSRGTYYEEAEPHEEPVEVQVSELDKERAMGLIKQAVDFHMRGNNDRAIKYLSDAYKKDPNLKRDSYTANLATNVTGLPPDEAYRMLTSDSFVKDATKKKKREGSATDETTWGDAIVELLIFGLLAGVIDFVLTVAVYLLIPGVIALAVANLQTYAQQSGDYSDFNASLLTSTLTSSATMPPVPDLVVSSVQFVIGCLIGLLLYYVLIHIISTMVLGGEGSYSRLIAKASLAHAIVVPILLQSFIFASMYVVAYPTNVGTAFTVGVATFLIGGFLTANRIGVAYRFGTGTGCAAIVLGIVAVFALSCGCYFAFLQAAMSSMGY